MRVSGWRLWMWSCLAGLMLCAVFGAVLGAVLGFIADGADPWSFVPEPEQYNLANSLWSAMWISVVYVVAGIPVVLASGAAFAVLVSTESRSGTRSPAVLRLQACAIVLLVVLLFIAGTALAVGSSDAVGFWAFVFVVTGMPGAAAAGAAAPRLVRRSELTSDA